MLGQRSGVPPHELGAVQRRRMVLDCTIQLVGTAIVVCVVATTVGGLQPKIHQIEGLNH